MAVAELLPERMELPHVVINNVNRREVAAAAIPQLALHLQQGSRVGNERVGGS
jgi:hypothetical protein